EQQFSSFRTYDSSQLLTAVQDDLIAQMVKDITEQIFNATVANKDTLPRRYAIHITYPC
ncbi:hypothetical protein EZS27_030881, partial [termite gut metagenome]